MKILTLLLAALFAAPALAQKPFAANGVPLGGSEADVKSRFPAAYCKALEWKSDAADRRCDDAHASLGGVEAKLTFYLKANAIQAFDVRFDTKDLQRFVADLKSSFGPPRSEANDVIYRKGKADREVYKVLWESGRDRAVLTAIKDRSRAQLEVSRGNFAEEIYRVR
ncbi:MAG: hypothetical protein AB7O31_05135 [Burkholderiales bacterium]